MATTRKQRIGIWIIAITMTVGTIGGFLVMILAQQNSAADSARVQKELSEYQAKYKTYQADITANKSKRYDTLMKYKDSEVKSFDASSVKKLETNDLVQGNGQALGDNASFTAYYIGWNPKGEIFDSSIDSSKNTLKDPFEAQPGGVIAGWTAGVKGMKVDGVRELTIPADQAYGKQSQGDKIPANTPLKFIIMVVPSAPAIPTDVLQSYQTGGGQQ